MTSSGVNRDSEGPLRGTAAFAFAGEFAPYKDYLPSGGDSRPAIPGLDLLTPPRLQDLLGRFGAQHVQPDLKAVASLWSKFHFSSVVIPALIADALAGYRLPLALDEIDVVVTAEGRTEALRLPHSGTPWQPRHAFERFTPLVEGHLDPLIQALTAQSGVAPRVFWGNAGNLLEKTVRRLEAAYGPDVAGLRDARQLLESRTWAGRPTNPLFRPVRYVSSGEGEAHRLRRVCCLRYLIPELDHCSACPLNRNATQPERGSYSPR